MNGLKICVIITSGPYTHEIAYSGLRFVNTALLDGHEVKLFLLEDGIYVALKTQDPTEYPNVRDWLNQGLETGSLEVTACGVCTKARGITEEMLVENVKVGTMHDLVAYVADCERTVTF